MTSWRRRARAIREEAPSSAMGGTPHWLLAASGPELTQRALGDGSAEVRVLSLWQPWASLLALGIKRIETRGWSTTYRGLLAIHAARTKVYVDPGSVIGMRNPILFEVLDHEGLRARDLPLGAVVGLVHLTDVASTTEAVRHASMREQVLGDYGPRRFAWITRPAGQLREPIPWTGAQGIRTAPPELVRLLAAAFVPTLPGTPAGGAATPRESQDQ